MDGAMAHAATLQHLRFRDALMGSYIKDIVFTGFLKESFWEIE